jgi:hypothetical protein
LNVVWPLIKKFKINLVLGKKVPEFLDSVWLGQTIYFTFQGEVFLHKNLTKKDKINLEI